MNREEVYLHWLVGGWGVSHFLKLDYRGRVYAESGLFNTKIVPNGI